MNTRCNWHDATGVAGAGTSSRPFRRIVTPAAKGKTKVITASEAAALLRYDHITGKLFWRFRAEEFFATKRAWKIWNKRFSGEEAFTSKDSHGYKRGVVLGNIYRAHRISWAIYHGYWPGDQIDHINRDRSDNRIKNLRLCSNLKNQHNKSIPKSNTSGFVGVYWHAAKGKWSAYITHNRKRIWLGRFDSMQDAIIARRNAEIKFGRSSVRLLGGA